LNQQTKLPVGVCTHVRTEDVRNETGEPIAVRCLGCAFVLGSYGTCAGCRAITHRDAVTDQPHKLLTVRREGKPARFYCTPDCLKATKKEEAAAKREAESLKDKPKAKAAVR
jgi:hypothetical protein